VPVGSSSARRGYGLDASSASVAVLLVRSK
jgi:hypothetical protein